MTRSLSFVALAVAVALAGCEPTLEQTSELITTPRVLAVRAAPAEAAPGTAVTLSALYADASGVLAEAPLDVAFCIARKPLAERGPIAGACLANEPGALVSIGRGASVSGTLPRDGCRLFGPNPPEPLAGEPAGRPADPDESGGFYQPVLIRGDDGAIDVSGVRITCPFAGTTQAQAAELTLRSRPNTAPAIESLLLVRSGGDLVELPQESTGGSAELAPGERVRLNVGWPACEPAAPSATCGGAETYVTFERITRTIVERREAMSIHWYVTGGTLETARSSRAASDGLLEADTFFTAPLGGDVTLVVVLRDDRGGVGFGTYRLSVD